MTSPTFGFPFPSLSDVPNVPADMEALAESVDSSLAQMVHLEGGGASTTPSVTTTITNYASVYGQSTWADQVSGQITVPTAGVYHVSQRVKVDPPGVEYNANGSMRDAGGGFSSQWFLAANPGLGVLTVTHSAYIHLPAGHVIWGAVFITAQGTTVHTGSLTARLIRPDGA